SNASAPRWRIWPTEFSNSSGNSFQPAFAMLFSPNGAAACSHGWSAAKPVGYRYRQIEHPGGVKEISVAPAGANDAAGESEPRVHLRRGAAAVHPWLHSVAPSGQAE